VTKEKIITVFGSGSSQEDESCYQQARALGRALAENGFAVCSGGYGGVMAGVSRGAKEGAGKTYGITADCFPTKANPWIDVEIRVATWQDRLFELIRLGDGFVACKGGTGTLAELVISTPGGKVCYEGDERIDGVPGTAAAIPINFLDAEGSVCGVLLPTGNNVDLVQGVEVTCIDNGMPVVILRAKDVGFEGDESCSEIEAAKQALEKIEAIRREAGERMGMGDVSQAVVPKVSLVSSPRNGGTLCTRNLIPVRCHTSIGVFAAVSIATACILPGSPAHALATLPAGKIKRLEIEHPTGSFAVRLEVGGTQEKPIVERAGLVRTARAIFDGIVLPRSHHANHEAEAG